LPPRAGGFKGIIPVFGAVIPLAALWAAGDKQGDDDNRRGEKRGGGGAPPGKRLRFHIDPPVFIGYSFTCLGGTASRGRKYGMVVVVVSHYRVKD
jgi:hypothetical protein